jgi:Cof subfamily protein (haloacid dehalogenase superfamily)
MIKMIVTDLDETLLHSDKTISVFTEETLLKARHAGIKVVLATGRPKRLSIGYHNRLQSDALICHNGNYIFSGGESVGSFAGISNKEAARILSILQEKYPAKKLSVEIDDRIYANFDVALLWGSMENESKILKSSAVLSDFTDLPDAAADKILIELDSEKEYREVWDLLTPELYAQPADGGSVCVVMNKSTSKFNAIRQLAELWDIPVSQITAFGDDHNDVEMIRGCGIGVAMENAVPEVREAADVITGTNNADGVAEYIRSRLL